MTESRHTCCASSFLSMPFQWNRIPSCSFLRSSSRLQCHSFLCIPFACSQRLRCVQCVSVLLPHSLLFHGFYSTPRRGCVSVFALCSPESLACCFLPLLVSCAAEVFRSVQTLSVSCGLVGSCSIGLAFFRARPRELSVPMWICYFSRNFS